MKYWKEIVIVGALVLAVIWKLYEQESVPKNGHGMTDSTMGPGKAKGEEPSKQASGSDRIDELDSSLNDTEAKEPEVSKSEFNVHRLEMDRVRAALELFPTLKVEKWFYEQNEKGIKQRTDAAFVTRGNPSELRLLKLIELKQGDMISFREESDLESLSKKFSDPTQSRVTFSDGKEYLENEKDPKLALPICSIKFNRSLSVNDV